MRRRRNRALDCALLGGIVGAVLAWVLFGRVMSQWNSPWRMAAGLPPLGLLEQMEGNEAAWLVIAGTVSDQIEAGRRAFIVLAMLGSAAGWFLWRRIRPTSDPAQASRS